MSLRNAAQWVWIMNQGIPVKDATRDGLQRSYPHFLLNHQVHPAKHSSTADKMRRGAGWGEPLFLATAKNNFASHREIVTKAACER